MNETACITLSYVDPYGKIVTCVFDSLSPVVLSEVKRLIIRHKSKV